MIAIDAASSEWWDEEQKLYIQPKSGRRMTRQQLGTMIAWEGLCYALTAAGATLAIGLPVAVGVCRMVSALSYGGTIVPYQFPLPEMALFLGVLFGLELLLSGWSIRREEKGGLLERIGQRP